MNRLIAILMPWRTSISVLNQRVTDLTIEKRLLSARIDQLASDKTALTEMLELQKRGNSVLLQFIQTSHRLTVPVEKDSIRAALQERTML